MSVTSGYRSLSHLRYVACSVLVSAAAAPASWLDPDPSPRDEYCAVRTSTCQEAQAETTDISDCCHVVGERETACASRREEETWCGNMEKRGRVAAAKGAGVLFARGCGAV